MPNSDDDVGRHAASLRRGCIVAAAGCGKTYQIATATAASDGKRLILTHTHAGVDAITTRLKERKVPPPKYHVDTIAGWCLRVSRSFPQRSGLDISVPLGAIRWEDVYQAGACLIRSGALSGVLHASYCGVFVDEYQDCSRKQHAVIQLLADELPCCVFGDHLQGIFDFGTRTRLIGSLMSIPCSRKRMNSRLPGVGKKQATSRFQSG
jgi:DNA helicase-2/ATP-dependent DNA helicase PcrA